MRLYMFYTLLAYIRRILLNTRAGTHVCTINYEKKKGININYCNLSISNKNALCDLNNIIQRYIIPILYTHIMIVIGICIQ